MNNKTKSCSDNEKGSCRCSPDEKNVKDEGCNCWDSVPTTYDKEESCHKNEKSATNNQWCSCNK